MSEISRNIHKDGPQLENHLPAPGEDKPKPKTDGTQGAELPAQEPRLPEGDRQ
ncbi:hypothetical protein V1L54_02970 [Streptomyces sp. TRM 70361]|uniref:hypothetical protein n=1 Tax=Streptomyces sp. TRM 70361 TaxID=3116553 RepID=UPI002E7B5CEA|nr:hypothetical protein [Streptomyces sp. TRM 70361]MEE1938383.1 hypothetical protein [Streptomyces sp. TRM 70361]